MPPTSELTRVLRELAGDPETRIVVHQHCRGRMRQRHMTLADIPSTLARSAVTEDQGQGTFGNRCRVQARDDEGKRIDIIVDMDEDEGTIWLITAI